MGEQCIATAEVLRTSEWLVRRVGCGDLLGTGSSLREATNSIHPNRDEARNELVRWARRHAWSVDRWPYGMNPVAKHLRKRPA